MILIAPIVIDGTAYCVDEQTGLRTERLYTGDGATDTEEASILSRTPIPPYNGYGTMKFGVICPHLVEITFTSDTAVVDFMSWEIHRNGVLFNAGTLAGVEVDFSVQIPLTPDPCGNIIEVVAGSSDSDPTTISCAISFPPIPVDEMAFFLPENSQYQPLI